MKRTTFKILISQLGIFLGYYLLFYRLHLSFLLIFAFALHISVLFFLSIRNWKKKNEARAFGFMIPLLLVLIIGAGSCEGMFAEMTNGVAENISDGIFEHRAHKNEKIYFKHFSKKEKRKMKEDSTRIADSIARSQV
ncbi:MAG: hypothetical protein HY064_03430 [Bacteroidetes bacterium]|nr:hypothetical protein [Bacteroidota bacterium]